MKNLNKDILNVVRKIKKQDEDDREEGLFTSAEIRKAICEEFNVKDSTARIYFRQYIEEGLIDLVRHIKIKVLRHDGSITSIAAYKYIGPKNN